MHIQRGFTLIELMVTLVIVGILAAVAVPAAQGQMANNKAKRLSTLVQMDLSYARSQAKAGGKPVTIKALGAAWSNGWEIIQEVADEPVILRIQGGEDAKKQLAAAGELSFSSVTAIKFQTNGFTNLDNDLTITIRPKGCTGKNGRELKMLTSGVLTKPEDLSCSGS